MVTFIFLNVFFAVTAALYVIFASQAFDQRDYAWFPFPRVDTRDWTITLLKVIPTYLCFAIACFAFEFGHHHYALVYAGFLFICGIIDWVIFKNNDYGIILATLIHVVSDPMVFFFMLETGLSTGGKIGLAIGALGFVAYMRGALGNANLGRVKPFILIYGTMLFLSLGAYIGLAFSPTPFPLWLRVSFFFTPLLILGVDGLYTINQYVRPVSQLWILGCYYIAIWLIAMNMIGVTRFMALVP